jgi:MscS family membrane protein
MVNSGMAQSPLQKAAKEVSKKGEDAGKPKAEIPKPVGPLDEFNRGVPRTSVDGFFKATAKGDYERAANYLDLRHLSEELRKSEGPRLARELKIVLDRAGLWIDYDLVSKDPKGQVEDGLPAYRDILGQIKTPKKTVDILMQRVPREDGVFIWKFSNRTLAQLPHLYEYFGYAPFEEALSRVFPDVVFLGWQLWQWAALLILEVLAFIAALVPTWIAGRILRRRDTEMSVALARFVTGPARFALWLLLGWPLLHLIGPSATIRKLMRVGTVFTIVLTWAVLRLVDLLIIWLEERLRRREQEETIVLLRPARTALRVIIITAAVLIWLDNLGFRVSTLLAGLGVGGLAVALAAQDTLKNLLGSIMILLDKPYKVGQRIVVKGHDGVVEEIGLRSTRMRLLTGHQTTIPNDEMARLDIENIGQRPHIRRLTNITITYDTPLDKVEKAVQIIEDILKDHEGMDPEFPPRVYFNEFNAYSLNIIMLYWYHPPDYWGFLAFNQRVNTQIMRGFEQEGIEFAFPTTTTYLAHDDHRPLQLSLASDAELPTEG